MTSVGSLFGGMDGCAFDDLMGISAQTLLSKPVAGRTVCKLYSIPKTEIPGWCSSKYAMPGVEPNSFPKPVSDEQVKAVQESAITGNTKNQ